jgi:hypothetical protein
MKVVELPSWREMVGRAMPLLAIVLFSLTGQPGLAQSMQLHDHDVVTLIGGTNVGNMRKDGYLETLMIAANQGKRLHIWNLGWDGDTAYEQFRDVGFGGSGRNLDSLGANVVFVQFGQMESLGGEAKIPDFISTYRKLLSEIRTINRRVILLSPLPFEPQNLYAGRAVLAVNPLENAPVEKYADAIREMAKQEKYIYIDLYHPLKASSLAGLLTMDGMHLVAQGQRVIAELIMESQGTPQKFSNKLEPLRKEVLTKQQLWIGYWRPGNWAFLGGDRTTVPFSHDWKDTEKRIFPEEIKAFEPLLREAERKISEQQRLLVTPN